MQIQLTESMSVPYPFAGCRCIMWSLYNTIMRYEQLCCSCHLCFCTTTMCCYKLLLTPSNATLSVCDNPVPVPVILILVPAFAFDAFVAN